MKIGYASRWIFVKDQEMDIFEELKWAHSLGFEVFGLNLDRKENRKLSDKELRELRKLADSLKMKIIVRSPHHLNTAVKSKKLFEEVRKNIRKAKLVGSDRLMIHPGHILNKLQLSFEESKSYKGRERKSFGISEKEIEERFEQLINNLKKIVSFSNIKIALENNGELYQFGSNLDEYYEILKRVKGLKSSISTGHANISGNNVYDYIKKCRSKIINLDIHDNKGKKDEHLPIGDGNIDFKKIFKILRSKRLTLLIDTYSNKLIEKSFRKIKEIK